MSDRIPPELVDLLLGIGKAEWGTTHEHTAIGHALHIRKSVKITAKDFKQTGKQKMHGLWVEGTETVICHTGTSPNSPQIARALTGAWNQLVDIAAAQKRRDAA